MTTWFTNVLIWFKFICKREKKKKARLLYIKLKRLMLHVYQLILISIYFDFNKSFLLLFL